MFCWWVWVVRCQNVPHSTLSEKNKTKNRSSHTPPLALPPCPLQFENHCTNSNPIPFKVRGNQSQCQKVIFPNNTALESTAFKQLAFTCTSGAVWINKTLHNIKNPYYSTFFIHLFQFDTLTFLPNTFYPQLSNSVSFYISFPSLRCSLVFITSCFHSSVKVAGCYFKASVRSVEFYVGVCKYVISLHVIRRCQSGLRSVQMYQNFPWSVQHTKPCRLTVSLLFICSSFAQKKRRHRKRRQEFAWCLMWYVRM